MPKYNVHLYREMRVKYFNVEAETPERAAELVRNIDPELCDYENETHECEGQSFGAVVDEIDPANPGHWTNETPINFDDGKLRDAAPQLLKALRGIFLLHEPEGRFQPSHYKPYLKECRDILEQLENIEKTS